MLARLLQMLGFRRDDNVERFVSGYGELNREQRDAILDAYTKENVRCMPAEQLIQAGLKLWRKGERKQALEHYDKAVALSPDDSIILLNRAHLNFELGRVDDALKDFVRARQGHPCLPERVFYVQTMLQTASPEVIELYVQKCRKDAA